MLTDKERVYLKIVRALISRGDEFYICYGLEEQNNEGTKRLRNYIARKLGKNCLTLGNWQRKRGIFHDERQQRKDRLDWIDWMLGDK